MEVHKSGCDVLVNKSMGESCSRAASPPAWSSSLRARDVLQCGLQLARRCDDMLPLGVRSTRRLLMIIEIHPVRAREHVRLLVDGEGDVSLNHRARGVRPEALLASPLVIPCEQADRR